MADTAADLIERVLDGSLSPYSALEQWPFPMEQWPLPLQAKGRTFVNAWTDLTHYADDDSLRDRDPEYAKLQRDSLKNHVVRLRERVAL